jgi:threonine dehydrogenase-like Zn-dependent dehydrogenase
MLAAGKISFPDMVTDVISLDDAVEKGLDRKDRKGQIKILINPSL